MAKIEDFSTCPRCSALVEYVGTHQRWHEQLEGTSDRLPKDPNEKPGELWSF